MQDTVALKHIMNYAPTARELSELGWTPRYSVFDGSYRAWIHNDPQNKYAPRLTISKCPQSLWHLRAEVSIPAWLNGSNTILPVEEDIEKFFPLLSKFVSDRSPTNFDAATAKIVRLDITKDFYPGETNVIPILRSISQYSIPRFIRIAFDDTTVEFRNSGSKKSKTIKFYSKFHEVCAKKRSSSEQDKALGILRLEVSHTSNAAIKTLQEQTNAKDTTAESLLKNEISEYVINKILHQFNLSEILSSPGSANESNREKLLRMYSTSKAIRLEGFLIFIKAFGKDFYNISRLNYQQRTYFKNLADCRKAGVFP